jgi:predicted Zn-dependent peptidase
MESVGGELNAYTSEELTVVHSTFPKGNLSRAIELIADLVRNSRFPSAEIERERDVVLDEINSYLDSPAEAIYDDFNDLIFAGTPMGHNILGTTDTINTFTSDTCRKFLIENYTPDNMVLFYSGPTGFDRLVNTATRYLGDMQSRGIVNDNKSELQVVAPFDTRKSLDTHQSHTLIGARIPGMYNTHNHVYALLTNILGGPCMNSLLNVALRERRGYVYSVDAYSSFFTDCGLFTIYFGCDEEHIKPCRRIVFDTIDRLASSSLTPRALEAAKKQYLGQTIVAGENRESAALAMGKATLFHGRVRTPEEIIESIHSITADELRMAAETITRQKSSVLSFV